MVDTALGMIKNMILLVDELGKVPNGGRIFFLGELFLYYRRQPWLAKILLSVTIKTLLYFALPLPNFKKELRWLPAGRASSL